MAQEIAPPSDRRSWLWLVLAAAILPFANGLPMVPIAIFNGAMRQAGTVTT